MVLKAQQQGRNKVPKQRGRGSRGSQRGTVVPTRSREMANDSRRGLGASLSVAGSGPLDALPQFSLPQITNAVLNQRLLIAVLALTAYAAALSLNDAACCAFLSPAAFLFLLRGHLSDWLLLIA